MPGSRNGLNPTQGYQSLNSVLNDSISLNPARGLNQQPQINVSMTFTGDGNSGMGKTFSFPQNVPRSTTCIFSENFEAVGNRVRKHCRSPKNGRGKRNWVLIPINTLVGNVKPTFCLPITDQNKDLRAMEKSNLYLINNR